MKARRSDLNVSSKTASTAGFSYGQRNRSRRATKRPQWLETGQTFFKRLFEIDSIDTVVFSRVKVDYNRGYGGLPKLTTRKWINRLYLFERGHAKRVL